jgi:hypothetical protein
MNKLCVEIDALKEDEVFKYIFNSCKKWKQDNTFDIGDIIFYILSVIILVCTILVVIDWLYFILYRYPSDFAVKEDKMDIESLKQNRCRC